MVLDIPSLEERSAIEKEFSRDLESFSIYDESKDEFLPVICCVCDSMPHHANWHALVPVNGLAPLLKKCKCDKASVAGMYPDALINDYTCTDSRLKEFVLSPATYITDEDEAVVCNSCFEHLVTNSKLQFKSRCPPSEAIINGYLIGQAPKELTELNPVELALISRVRIYSQSWIFFAGCHQHIKGWHTCLKNELERHVATVQALQESGFQRTILVALCGPFTSTQRAMTLKKTAVDPDKVVKAWKWLKENNHRYKDDVIPSRDDIPVPIILDEEK